MKIINKAIGAILRVLLKVYKREDAPIVVTTNVGNVVTNFPEDGGVESWIPGHDLPFPGMPDSRKVEMVGTVKRMFPVACKYAWLAMRDNLPDPKRYSRPVREIYRVLSLIREREGDDPSQIDQKGQWTEIRDILCMILEWDDAYRFRFMDAMNEIKIEEFSFSPADKYWSAMKWKYIWGWQKKEKENKIEV